MLSLLCISPLLIAWAGCFWVARELAARRSIDPDWRLSWLFACLGFGSVLTLIVEISSLAHHLNRPTMALLWVVADVIIFWAALQLNKRRPLQPEADPEIAASRLLFRNWPFDSKMLMAATLLIVLFLFFVALLTPTTNIDSLSYHLARMAHWIQQGSVDHYPTDDLRQIEFGPWSSFVMTNLFLLWGNDRLLNLVQWFAMVSSLILLSWMVQSLWGFFRGTSNIPEPGRRTEARALAFTCLIAATLPIGMVESISTQNDYSTAFWVMSIFALGLVLMKEPANRYYVCAAGLAAGLGTLTKATTYMYVGPLILAGGLWWLRLLYIRQKAASSEAKRFAGLRDRLACLQVALVFVGAFFLLNAPHMARNYSLFGSPLGSPEMMSLERNESLSHRVFASNVIRNMALHTNSGIPWLTHGLNRALTWLHHLTGEEFNDPRTTFSYCRFEFREKFSVSDSVASCIVHFTLCSLVLGLLVLRPIRHQRIFLYLAPILLSMLFFAFFLKWQTWHSRIHLAWFLLLAPCVAFLFCERGQRWPVWAAAVALLIFAGASIAANTSRPVFSAKFRALPREKQYFTPIRDEQMRESFVELTDRIIASRCQNVGLKAVFCGLEYPLWMMLKNRGFTGRLDRCFVENVTASIPAGAPKPEVVISVFNIIPEGVSNSYPHIEKFSELTVMWAKKPEPFVVGSLR
jgi:hypothetical protein